MNDTTNEELLYILYTSLTISGVHVAITDDHDIYCVRSFFLSPGISLLLSLPVLTVGAWALVQAGYKLFYVLCRQ